MLLFPVYTSTTTPLRNGCWTVGGWVVIERESERQGDRYREPKARRGRKRQGREEFQTDKKRDNGEGERGEAGERGHRRHGDEQSEKERTQRG